MLLKRQHGRRSVNGFVYDEAERLVAWASDIIGFVPRPDVMAIGWQEHGQLRAVTLYDCFSPCDCNMHIASDGSSQWLRKSFLQRSFMHPFVQWKFRRVTGLVPAKNTAALQFDLKLGFQREGLCRHALPDDDIIIMGLLREDCRFIPKSHRG